MRLIDVSRDHGSGGSIQSTLFAHQLLLEIIALSGLSRRITNSREKLFVACNPSKTERYRKSCCTRTSSHCTNSRSQLDAPPRVGRVHISPLGARVGAPLGANTSVQTAALNLTRVVNTTVTQTTRLPPEKNTLQLQLPPAQVGYMRRRAGYLHVYVHASA